MSPPSSATSSRAELTRRLIVSFHDLHPGSRIICGHFLEALRRRGVERISLLVVPRWHGGRPFVDDEEFTGWLHARAAEGHDLCLHGFFHRAEDVGGGPWSRLVARHYTQSEGEFYQIDLEVARDRVKRGLALFGEAGLPVHGFTPPAWLLSREGRAALRESGLHYTTTFSGVDLLQQGRWLPAPTIVYSCRSAWRRMVSRGWVRFWAQVNRHAPLLRIAAHPGDFKDARVEASLLHLIERALADGRQSVTYRDLLAPGTPPLRVDPLAAA
jgi:uncharacterized protein